MEFCCGENERVQAYLYDVTDIKNLGVFTKEECINEQKEHTVYLLIIHLFDFSSVGIVFQTKVTCYWIVADSLYFVAAPTYC